MGFGFSPSDFIALPTFAWTLYKTCCDAGDDFKRIKEEVSSLLIVLRETQNIY
jgi:hypothetical protein